MAAAAGRPGSNRLTDEQYQIITDVASSLRPDYRHSDPQLKDLGWNSAKGYLTRISKARPWPASLEPVPTRSNSDAKSALQEKLVMWLRLCDKVAPRRNGAPWLGPRPGDAAAARGFHSPTAVRPNKRRRTRGTEQDLLASYSDALDRCADLCRILGDIETGRHAGTDGDASDLASKDHTLHELLSRVVVAHNKCNTGIAVPLPTLPLARAAAAPLMSGSAPAGPAETAGAAAACHASSATAGDPDADFYDVIERILGVKGLHERTKASIVELMRWCERQYVAAKNAGDAARIIITDDVKANVARGVGVASLRTGDKVHKLFTSWKRRQGVVDY